MHLKAVRPSTEPNQPIDNYLCACGVGEDEDWSGEVCWQWVRKTSGNLGRGLFARNQLAVHFEVDGLWGGLDVEDF